MEIKEFEAYEKILCHMRIFDGIPLEKIRPLVELLDGKEKIYTAKSVLWKPSTSHKRIGIVLNGSIQSENPAREEEIIQRFHAGNSFGEAIAFGNQKSWVTIRASEDSRILFLSAQKVLENKNNEDVILFMSNLLKEFSKKLAMMSFKNQLLSEPKVRNRLLMYISTLPSDKNGFKKIPFLQKDLAQYLNVNKSAFNRELARMKKENIIEIDGNKIKVK